MKPMTRDEAQSAGTEAPMEYHERFGLHILFGHGQRRYLALSSNASYQNRNSISVRRIYISSIGSPPIVQIGTGYSSAGEALGHRNDSLFFGTFQN